MENNFEEQVWWLLQNDHFIQWVREPDAESSTYWENWKRQSPGRAGALHKARQILIDMTMNAIPPDARSLSEVIWDRVNSDIDIEPAATTHTVVTPLENSSRTPALKRLHWRRYGIAVALAGALLLGAGIYYYSRPGHMNGPASPGPAEQKIARVLVNDNLKRTNQTQSNQVLYLVDGSKVVLQPGSSINHAIFLQKDKREIFLEGNAFFEVAEDPARPFYVYTKDIVMRVLGTGFNVTVDSNNGNISVIVRTGKVSVYRKSSKQQAQLVLTQNQRALYDARTRHLMQSRLGSLEALIDKTPANLAFNFDFEEIPVEKIFQSLENAYGITIHFDKQSLAGCRITTSLGEESFEVKLKIICEAIGASYRITDNSVFIVGGSCNGEKTPINQNNP